MGVTMTKAQPVAAARKKKHKPGFLPVIHEYVPKPHQLRSKTLDLHYRRNDKLTSLAQVRAIMTRNPVFGVCHVHQLVFKVSKGVKIRNRYNQVPHPTQDTNGKVTNSQLDTTNESQEVSSFPAGDHKAHINRRAHRHSKHKTEQKHKRSTKEVSPWNGQ